MISSIPLSIIAKSYMHQSWKNFTSRLNQPPTGWQSPTTQHLKRAPIRHTVLVMPSTMYTEHTSWHHKAGSKMLEDGRNYQWLAGIWKNVNLELWTGDNSKGTTVRKPKVSQPYYPYEMAQPTGRQRESISEASNVKLHYTQVRRRNANYWSEICSVSITQQKYPYGLSEGCLLDQQAWFGTLDSEPGLLTRLL